VFAALEDDFVIDDPVLIDDWHPVARVEDLASGKPIGVRLLGVSFGTA
jgi:hypothetical protein